MHKAFLLRSYVLYLLNIKTKTDDKARNQKRNQNPYKRKCSRIRNRNQFFKSLTAQQVRFYSGSGSPAVDCFASSSSVSGDSLA